MSTLMSWGEIGKNLTTGGIMPRQLEQLHDFQRAVVPFKSESGQKVQTSTYKISKSWACNVQPRRCN